MDPHKKSSQQSKDAQATPKTQAQPRDLEQFLAAPWLETSIVSDAQIDEELEALGFDLDELEATARQLTPSSGPQWRAQARARQLEHQATLARHQAALRTQSKQSHTKSAPRTRQALLAALDLARKDPVFGQEVAAYFRLRAPEEATDQELEGLLDDLETLRALTLADSQD